MTEPESLVEQSADSLSQRDFPNCRKYALLARQSDPNLSSIDQILAIADVLVAADRRIDGRHPDWYSVLQVHRSDAVNPTARDQFKRLVLLLNPWKNHFAYSREAFRVVRDAWSVLSNPERKALYDSEIGPEGEGQSNGTFWTACPYCFYVYEYDKVYEECCLRCQNCRRPFHGAAVAPPPPSVVVDGEEAYVCSYGFFPVGYSAAVNDGSQRHGDAIVEISDDSEEECEVKGSESELNVGVKGAEKAAGFVNVGEKTRVRREGKKAMRNVKSVARNTRKLMGTGRLRLRNGRAAAAGNFKVVDLNVQSGKWMVDDDDGGTGKVGGECDYGDLVFLDADDDDGDGDILVGLSRGL